MKLDDLLELGFRFGGVELPGDLIGAAGVVRAAPRSVGRTGAPEVRPTVTGGEWKP